MALNWTTQIARKETLCKNYMGYSLQLAARDLSHRQDSSLGALDETRNSSVGPL